MQTQYKYSRLQDIGPMVVRNPDLRTDDFGLAMGSSGAGNPSCHIR
jgi:hypothetical protein